MPTTGHVSYMLLREQTYTYQTGRTSPVPKEGAAGCSPSEVSWVTLLESKPLDGNHSQHPFASRGQTHGGWAGALRDCPVVAAGRVKAGKNISWQKGTSQDWH